MNSTSIQETLSKEVKTMTKSKIIHYTRAECEWVIQNYSLRHYKTGDFITSPWFSDNTSKPQEWQIKIYPMGLSEDCKKFISLFVHLKKTQQMENEVTVQLKLSLLNSKKTTLASSGSHSAKLKKENSFSLGLPNMMKIKDLFKPKTKFLLDDELHIICEIVYEVKKVNISSDGKLIGHFQQLMDSKSLADVIIDVKGQKFDAHKLILSARSPVFYAMFQSDFSEQKDNTLEVKDIEPDVFVEVLRFIYTDKAEKLEEMAPQLLAAADKYMLDLLKKKCEAFLARKVTLDNCGELLVLAHLHSSTDLKHTLLDFVRFHSSEVALTCNWQRLLAAAHPQLLRDISMALMTTGPVPTASPLCLIKKDV